MPKYFRQVVSFKSILSKTHQNPNFIVKSKTQDHQNNIYQNKIRRQSSEKMNCQMLSLNSTIESFTNIEETIRNDNINFPAPDFTFDASFSLFSIAEIEKGCNEIRNYFQRKESILIVEAYFLLKRTRSDVLAIIFDFSKKQIKDKRVRQYYRSKIMKKYFIHLKHFIQKKKQQKKECFELEYDSDDTSTSLNSIRSEIPYFSFDDLQQNTNVSAVERDNSHRSQQFTRFQLHAKRLQNFVMNQCETGNRVLKKNQTVKSECNNDCIEFMRSESENTLAAVDNALNYAKNLKQHSGHNLINVLENVIDTYEQTLKRKYLRKLMHRIMEKTIHGLFVRKKLKNYTRLCKVYRIIDANIHRYYELRLQKNCFDHWFDSLYRENITRSLGMLESCKRMKKRLIGYDIYLMNQNVKPIFRSYKSLNVITSAPRAIFLRWVSYTAKKQIINNLLLNFQNQSKYRLQQRIFYKLRRTKYAKIDYHSCFLLKRYAANIDIIMKYYHRSQKNNLTSIIRTKNLERKEIIMKSARESPSFKKFLYGVKDEVYSRIHEERNMLQESFQYRGCLAYYDEKIRNQVAMGDAILIDDSLDMNHEHKTKVNKSNLQRSWIDDPLPTGFHLSEICINIKPGQGIVGKFENIMINYIITTQIIIVFGKSLFSFITNI